MARVVCCGSGATARNDVEAVLAAATKELAGNDGCVNVWGYGPSRKRIRVTLDPTCTLVVTVANADSRTRNDPAS
jgi:hypothetical protein